jgi:hypothetical protein
METSCCSFSRSTRLTTHFGPRKSPGTPKSLLESSRLRPRAGPNATSRWSACRMTRVAWRHDSPNPGCRSSCMHQECTDAGRGWYLSTSPYNDAAYRPSRLCAPAQAEQHRESSPQRDTKREATEQGKRASLVLVMHLGDRPEARVDGVRNVRLMRNARAIRPACGGTLTLCTFRDFGTCSIPVEAFSWPMLRRPSCW